MIRSHDSWDGSERKTWNELEKKGKVRVYIYSHVTEYTEEKLKDNPAAQNHPMLLFQWQSSVHHTPDGVMKRQNATIKKCLFHRYSQQPKQAYYC